MRPTVDGVDNRHDVRREVREFLTTRRARITPDRAGLPITGSRRVPGLRRSEVATLAGLSVEYYARLERGQIAGASSGVLEALARALQLDETERTPVRPRPRGRRHPGLGPAPAPRRRQGRVPPEPALGAGGNHRRSRVRQRPTTEPARHQHARPR